MNRKSDPSPRFAVNRTAMLSRLPGVKISDTSKRFVRAGPKLETSAWEPRMVSVDTRLSGQRGARKSIVRTG